MPDEPSMKSLHPLLFLCIVTVVACKGTAADGTPAASTDTLAAAPAGVVDSLLPIEEEIRRFRLATPDSIGRLEGGARGREALVKAYVAAIEMTDSLALHGLLISRAEYAWLVYPESELTRPPYRQKPALAWFMMQNATDQGIIRVLNRHGGKTLGYSGLACEPEATVQGANRIWRQCRMRFTENGAEVERKLFGGILERDGTYKFLTYATDY
jgi:hypothetical protein